MLLREKEYFLARSQLVPELPLSLSLFFFFRSFLPSMKQLDPAVASFCIQVAQEEAIVNMDQIWCHDT